MPVDLIFVPNGAKGSSGFVIRLEWRLGFQRGRNAQEELWPVGQVGPYYDTAV